MDTLFEYSESVRRNDTDRYCDYYVARIFEDVMEILPNILEAVPQDLTRFISGNSGREWIKTHESWSEQKLNEGAGREVWDTWDRANLLLCNRFLDSGYLTPSTSILMWSDDDNVHIEWDNSENFVDGVLAWSAVSGSFHLPREKFVIEVDTFQTRLFEQMKSRIDQIAAGVLHPDIQIDLPGLISENEQRQGEFTQALRRVGATSWGEIRSAVLEISADAESMPS